MDKIDISELIGQFNEHLKANERTIFSAHFGDGKSCFLQDFMNAYSDQYEFIVLYPVNYQIASNDAIMEYIKRDILFQLILKGHIKSGVEIPEHLLLQWYLSQNTPSLFLDIIKFLPSITSEGSTWRKVLTALLELSQTVGAKVSEYSSFKKEILKQDDFSRVASYIEQASTGNGNIYEMDLMTFLIVQAVTNISNDGRKTVLIIEDLDRLDPAHLFRILNVFSAHIDRNYQCSTYTVKDSDGSDKPIDELKNKFGFDNVVFVMDYDATHSIYNHFYGERANYQGYIGKFLSHSVFQFSISEYAHQLLRKHLDHVCKLPVNKLFPRAGAGVAYLTENDISIRTIARLLDDFDDSIVDTLIAANKEIKYHSRNALTCTISTLRQLGLDDAAIKRFLNQEMTVNERLNHYGMFLMKQEHLGQSFTVYYMGSLYQFVPDTNREGVTTIDRCSGYDRRDPEQFKFLDVDLDQAYAKACKYVK